MDEKSSESEARSLSLIGLGVGERVEKKWWLFQAMEAWLKREASLGFRAVARRMSRVSLFSLGVPVTTLSASTCDACAI